jgi:hypothetical protein
MKSIFTVLLAGLLTGLIATAALAAAAKDPCAKDVAALCNGVKPGEGRILACLKEHEESVSGACKDHLMEIRDKVLDAQKACQGDVKQLCPGVKPGEGRIVNCLKQHRAELSRNCREKLGAQ